MDCYQLRLQLAMFHAKWKCKTIVDVSKCLHESCSEVRSLFDQVERLVRLLLVRPVSTCEAERTFSALRRLKRWLRSSMSQKRLNSVAMCHVHHDILDILDLNTLMNEFISRNE